MIIVISFLSQAQFVTTSSSYEFTNTITADSSNFAIESKSISLVNQGEQTVLINGVYEITPGQYLTLGGLMNVVVRDTIDISFVGTGTKKLNIIKESSESY